MFRFPFFRAVSRFAPRALAALLAFSMAPLSHAQVGPQATPMPTPNATPAASPTPIPGATPAPTAAPQDPRKTDTPGQNAPAAGPSPTPTPAASPTPAPPKTIEELTKGFDKSEGIFTLYRKTERNDQKLLAEVKEAQIGPLFLLQSTFASGNAGRITAGRPADDLVWRFEKTPDDRLILSVPNLWYRSSDPNLKQAVERDFPDAYLAAFPILARSTDKKTVLIDFSAIFDGGVSGINTALQSDGPFRGLSDSYILDGDLSFYRAIKNFPTNLVVEARYNFKRVGPPTFGGGNRAQADPRSLPINVTYNLYALPQSDNSPGDYRPRLADPRVGFFINGQLSAGRVGFESFDDDAAADPRVAYINRWNLQKKDPKSKISAPIKPIVFYLDTSIPLAYRGAVREGILGWNRAFEPLGFKGAIEVKDAPSNDWDTADMRFNTIRWVASPPSESGAYAVALMRENPLTGEILNAGINVNANFVRVAFQEKQEIVNPLGDIGKSKIDGGIACEIDGHFHQNAILGREIAQVAGPPLDNKTYVNQLLRALVAHEFGHILGLRHNFVASTFLSPAQLKNPKIVREEGTSASVMDYVGFNAFGLETGAPLFASGPGKYDKWAISYGYTPVSAASPRAEKPFLKPIVARSNERGLEYQSDDLADDFDPSIVRYDLSSDPLAYTEKSFDVTRQLLKTLGARKPKTGETYASFTRRLRGLIRANGRDAQIAARYVGGALNRRAVKGDKNEKTPFSPVPLSQQRRALDILSRRIFAPNALNVPREYFTQTAPDPYDFSDPAADAAFPIRDDIARVKLGVLNTLFDGNRLARIANTTYKFPSQTLGFPELFGRVRSAIWGNLNAKTPFSASQRDLAGAHLRVLLDLALEKRAAPADARLVARNELVALKNALSGPRKTAPDAFSRLFYADTLRRIDAGLSKKSE